MTATLHSKGNSVPGSVIAAERSTLGEAEPRKRKEDDEIWAFAIADVLVR